MSSGPYPPQWERARGKTFWTEPAPGSAQAYHEAGIRNRLVSCRARFLREVEAVIKQLQKKDPSFYIDSENIPMYIPYRSEPDCALLGISRKIEGSPKGSFNISYHLDWIQAERGEGSNGVINVFIGEGEQPYIDLIRDEFELWRRKFVPYNAQKLEIENRDLKKEYNQNVNLRNMQYEFVKIVHHIFRELIQFDKRFRLWEHRIDKVNRMFVIYLFGRKTRLFFSKRSFMAEYHTDHSFARGRSEKNNGSIDVFIYERDEILRNKIREEFEAKRGELVPRIASYLEIVAK